MHTHSANNQSSLVCLNRDFVEEKKNKLLSDTKGGVDFKPVFFLFFFFAIFR